jgi:MFS family permease
VAARKFNTPRSQAAMLTGTLAASTVILNYLSNPHVTATALAALAITTTSALFSGKTAAIIGGASLGWLAMINPYAALLGGSLWFATTLQRNLADKRKQKLSRCVRQFALAAISAIVVFVLFLIIGAQLFPGMNWFQTYIDWNAKLDYSDFASTSPVWLTDPSLLVPISMFIVVAINWWKYKTPQTQAALTIVLTTLGVTISFLPAMAGITLEATIYTAMLWIPMSIALILSLSNNLITNRWLPPATIALLIIFGFASPGLNGPIVITLAAITTSLLIAAKNPKLTAAALIIFLASAQLIQNSRDQIGLYYSSPFAWAFHGNPIKLKLANSLKAQKWLLANTTPQDQILTYVDGDWQGGDRDLYVAASLQFWGENRISVTRELRPEDLLRLEELKPNVFALYGPNKDRLQQYVNSLPNADRLSPLNCLDFDWPTSTMGASLCLSATDNGAAYSLP